ncbi:MAG TPA: hypothetical protein VGJ83_07540 [Gemmatimonadales bacterium]|jgi:hypothetical protein
MKALTRNALLAIPLALVFFVALPRQGKLWWDLLDDFTLAFAFTYVGYFVEVLLLKLPGIGTGAGPLVRLVGWFAGGLWCYELGRWALLAYGRDTGAFPPLVYGGFIFIALQLVLHTLKPRVASPQRPT